MSVRVGNDGFARIGRNVFPAAQQSEADVEIVAVDECGYSSCCVELAQRVLVHAHT